MTKINKLIILFSSISLGLLVPILSLLLISKGCTLSELALVMGGYSFIIIALELPSGIFADLFGRKTVFIISIVSGFISAFILLFSDGYLAILSAIVFQGIGRAFSSGAMDALIIDEFILKEGKDKLPRVTAQLELFNTIGIAIGAIIGGMLPNISQQLFETSNIYNLNLIIKMILGSMIAILTLFFVKETYIREASKKVSIKEHIKESIYFIKGNKVIRLLMIAIFLSGFFLSVIETYWQPHFRELLVDDALLWLLGFVSFGSFMFAAVGNIIMEKILGKGHFNVYQGYRLSRILLMLCVVLFALQQTAFGFSVAYFLLYFIFGAHNIAESTILNGEVPSDQRSSILSFTSLVLQGGGLVAAIVGSRVVYYKNISSLWFYTGVVLFILSICINGLLSKTIKNKQVEKQKDCEAI